MIMKVLILDLTHGGDVLAREYMSRGDEVTAVDIYRTAPAIAQRLSAEGVRCPHTAPEENFDLAVVPVHCPDRYLGRAASDRVITHHKAVGELAKPAFPTVEVTGVRGKTSTVQVLSYLMAARGARVLSLSSSGLSSWNGGETVLEDRVSIAPPTVLRVTSAYRDHDLGVFEISLGGTGLGKVSVITGLQEDYPIAAGTRRAYEGKSQMAHLARGTLVIPEGERDLWRPLATRCDRVMTFGEGGDVNASVSPGALGTPSRLTVTTPEGESDVELGASYLASAYELAFSCALAAAYALGHGPMEMAPLLRGFGGAKGRGKVAVDEMGELVRERNPGVTAASLEFLIDKLVGEHGCRDIGLVLDPVNRKVCEKLDMCRVKEVCDRYPQVTGRYLLRSAGELGAYHGFDIIDGVDEARGRHRTVLWATKEGYI